jgi:hypothetical protein
MMTELVRAVPAANSSSRLGARMSWLMLPRRRTSSITCQVAPTFHVPTQPEVE